MVDLDRIDIAAKLMIPLVMAQGGAFYSWLKDAVDLRRRQWQRDSSYIV